MVKGEPGLGAPGAGLVRLEVEEASSSSGEVVDEEAARRVDGMAGVALLSRCLDARLKARSVTLLEDDDDAILRERVCGG